MSIGTWRKRLKRLIEWRQEKVEDIAQHEETLKVYNAEILKILTKHKRKTITLAGFKTDVIQNSSLTLDETMIIEWYRRKNRRPPVKEAFDEEKFEEDLTKKRVPMSLLRKYSKVKQGNPYIRISKAQKK